MGFDPAAPDSAAHLRVGVLRLDGQICDAPVEPEIQAAVDTAIEVLRSLVLEVREAELPMPDLGALIDAEAWDFHAPHIAATPELYDPRTQNEILLGRGIPEAERLRLRHELESHRAAIHAAFTSVDLVVLPTLPQLPMLIEEAIEPFAFPACTFAFSIGGLPAISVPCGRSRSGLPIGLMISGPPLGDVSVLALAQAYETAVGRPWRSPPLGD